MLKNRVRGLLCPFRRPDAGPIKTESSPEFPVNDTASNAGGMIVIAYLVLIVILSLSQIISAYAQSAQTISGKVTDERGESLAGAIIKIKGTMLATSSGREGTFRINSPSANPTLIISFIGYQPQESTLKPGQTFLSVSLSPDSTQLNEVQIVSTGYQQIPKERATGSFVQIDSALLNRRVSTTILDRLDGLVSGLIFNKNAVSSPGANISAISIRGRSTIFAEAEPLIVLDNFPYDGDLSNINPNDIASVSVLRDAAAASIWGARSGNGVIVLTSKTGRLNQAPKVSFNSNVSISAKPDLFYQPVMSAADYISVEEFLFSKGYFDSRIGTEYQPLSPVVQLLNEGRNNPSAAAGIAAEIEALKSSDIRNDELRYYYRRGLNQQYSLNINGGSQQNTWYASAGYDGTRGTSVFNRTGRVTVSMNDKYQMLNNRLELSSALYITSTTNNAQAMYQPGIGVRYPYGTIADAAGNALPVYSYYRKSWLDTLTRRKADWEFRPLDEIHLNNNKSTGMDYRVNTSLRYHVTEGLNATVLYQYSRGTSERRELYPEESFYARDLVNSYQGIIPEGAVLNSANTAYTTNNLRVQADLNRQWKRHRVSALAGAEFKNYNTRSEANTLYGYNEQNESFTLADFTTTYPTIPRGDYMPVPNQADRATTADHYLSYFANASYTYNGRYTVSGSARRDESNLFGVKTNQKGVPLWSAGLAWNVSDEAFWHLSWLPYLKLRLTTGYNGNVDKTLSALTTASLAGPNVYQANYSIISNPPNPALRWEKIRMLNAGIDFALADNRISGTAEYYRKKGKDMIGTSPLPPQTGVTTFKGNTANISGNGLDLTLNAIVLKSRLRWETILQYSYAKDKVDRYLFKQPSVALYVNGNYTSPMEGYPYMALFSFKWAGLDASTGNPMGYADGAAVADYARLLNPSSPDEVVYSGSQSPVSFGNFRNTISWKGLSISANVTYKLGYVFRNPSVQYSALYSGMLNGQGTSGHADFARRWQQPGDEAYTHVPSMIYPLSDTKRDDFYARSEVLVEKGDHVRLQDIRCGYALPGRIIRRLGLQSASVYGYASNLGIIWKATGSGLDPDYIYGMPNPVSVSFGFNASF